MGIVGAYGFAGLCLIGVAIGGYFALNKMKEQKETMRRLANVAFKDVTDSQPPVQDHYPTLPVGLSVGDPTTPAVLLSHATVATANNGFFGDSQTQGFFHEPNTNNGSTTPAANEFGKYQKM
jgi:hypothetical protein